MAERRMFAKTIIDSDIFLDMPLSTQALYFHLAMRADDDGFVNNPKKIARMIGADDDSLRILSAKRFLIPFESGVVVIRHWKIHNYIQKDRYKGTVYTEEKSMLNVHKNGMYTECIQGVSKMDTERIPDVYQMETQDRLGKVSIGEVNNNNGHSTIEQDKPVRVSSSDFERLWELYPRKEGKKDAFAAYQRAVKHGTTVETIESGINRYNSHIEKCKIEKQYIKKGSTWFRQESWNDVYDDSTVTQSRKKSSYDISMLNIPEEIRNGAIEKEQRRRLNIPPEGKDPDYGYYNKQGEWVETSYSMKLIENSYLGADKKD